jgi:hypothetical protein
MVSRSHRIKHLIFIPVKYHTPKHTAMKAKSSGKKNAPDKPNELKTEPPISEKDEVKKAEERTRKTVKKNL